MTTIAPSGRLAPLRLSPLAHRGPIAAPRGEVRMAERPFVPKHILRADPREAAEDVERALGLAPPLVPLSVTENGDVAALWLGPDEFLIVGLAEDAERALAEALAPRRHQLVDVGDYYTLIEVEGPRARELLLKLTTLDLHPRAFPAGRIAGSLLGRANAWIWLQEDAAPAGARFAIFVRWSFADYLWCALAEAGREWGLPEETPVSGEPMLQESVGV